MSQFPWSSHWWRRSLSLWGWIVRNQDFTEASGRSEESLLEMLPIREVTMVFETFSVVTSMTWRLLTNVVHHIERMSHIWWGHPGSLPVTKMIWFSTVTCCLVLEFNMASYCQRFTCFLWEIYKYFHILFVKRHTVVQMFLFLSSSHLIRVGGHSSHSSSGDVISPPECEIIKSQILWWGWRKWGGEVCPGST